MNSLNATGDFRFWNTIQTTNSHAPYYFCLMNRISEGFTSKESLKGVLKGALLEESLTPTDERVVLGHV